AGDRLGIPGLPAPRRRGRLGRSDAGLWGPHRRASGFSSDGLLPVALDRVRVAHLRGIGVAARVAQCAALPQQVPAAVELDLDAFQPRPIGLEGVVVVRLFALTELVLLVDQLLD